MRTERTTRLLRALDLTRLVSGDDPSTIQALCASTVTPMGSPAAVCVLPAYVTTAVASLREAGLRPAVRVATVANFPDGGQPLARILASIDRSLDNGADEIDLVLPWRDIAAGRIDSASVLLAEARDRVGPATLKVILETGALAPEGIDRAAELALDHAADFLKTSTGVGQPGASFEAAERLLDRIAARGLGCGLKVSGGIRTVAEADRYLRLAEQRMGPDWPTPARFRIGASGLFNALLQEETGVQ